MFTDDFLFTGEANIYEWMNFHYILTRFRDASGLIMNKEKLKFITKRLEAEAVGEISNLFKVKVSRLARILRSLGFLLKPNKYKCQD